MTSMIDWSLVPLTTVRVGGAQESGGRPSPAQQRLVESASPSGMEAGIDSPKVDDRQVSSLVARLHLVSVGQHRL